MRDFGKDVLGKMNKIQKSWYNIIGKLSNARIRFFLKLAGFHNIESMKIVCNDKSDQTTFTMGEDGIIHRVISLKINIDTKVKFK